MLFAVSIGFVHLYTLRLKEKEKRAAVMMYHVALQTRSACNRIIPLMRRPNTVTA
jgi:hypothetical protein